MNMALPSSIKGLQLKVVPPILGPVAACKCVARVHAQQCMCL